jgi:ankyrin repeat protein/mono/diheme cytochrome c family protein
VSRKTALSGPALLLFLVSWHFVQPPAGQAQAAAPQLPPAATGNVDYDKDIKPLLSQNCYSCHGPNAQQSGLRLDLRQNALRGGDYGPVILPGKSAESKLIRRLVDGDGGMQMPPSGPLSTEDIGILRAWIDQGAEFRTDIADEVPPKPIDPKLAAAIAAVRAERRAVVEKLVAATPGLIKATDPEGATLLHHAAGFGRLDTMSWLLDAGADVNAKSPRGATALHWAIHDEAKVRLLLTRGALVNAKQFDGKTPLLLAASLGNGHATLRLLLEFGADPSTATMNGQTPLMAAAIRADVEAMGLLLAKNGDVNAKNAAGETALMLAATDGNPKAVALLLDRGADARVRTKRNETALGNASTSGNEQTVRLLLDRGAEVDVQNIRGFSPLMLAASSETSPAGVVKLLLAKGANTGYTGDYNETARDLASKRGDTEVARLLGGAVTANPATPAVVPAVNNGRGIAEAVEKSFGPMEQQSHNFIRISGCNSCHSQDLVSAAAGFARSKGLRAPREIAQLPASMRPPAERIMAMDVINVGGLGWELFDFGMNGAPKNAYTDASVRYIKAMQTAAGNWSANENRRPPINAGDFQFSALAIYALKHYTPVAEQKTTDEAIARAVRWLERTPAESTQDRAFQAMGLAWANAPSSARKAAGALLAMQRSDGGWSQLPTVESDAYATGQALYALNVAGAVPATDPQFRKGIDYLLRTQATDGTWHVKSRAIWLQPYFESGFPYGRDQFISVAGSAWASIALSTAVTPTMTTRR